MNLLKLSWRNATIKPLSTLLSVVLFALGVGLIALLVLVKHQLDEQLERNLAGVNMVVGAKGSPMQLILSSIYHVDFPTGNIKLSEANRLRRHPWVKKSIPLALGDSYKGYRIVGTEHNYISIYEGALSSGALWSEKLEVTLGHLVAKRLNLAIGDTFHSSHGLGMEGMMHDETDPFRVVGILEPSNSVLDQLILTNIESVWAVHDDGGGADVDSTTLANREITSLLLFFKNKMAHVAFPRMINEQTSMQSASPAFETARLDSMLGSGEKALMGLAYLIVFISGLSIFIALYNSLKERRYEVALMRVMGASPSKIFMLIILEGLLLALLGYLLGIAACHIGVWLLGDYISEAYRYDLSPFLFLKAELWLLVAALLIGFIAAFIPAIQNYNRSVSEELRG